MKPKIKLYYDGRKCSDKERCPVYVKITHIRTTAYIVTDIHLLAAEWSKETECVIRHPNKTAFNRHLSALVESYREKINALVITTDISRYTAAQIKELLTARPNEEKYLFWKRFQAYTEKLSSSSKRMFNQTADRIREFDRRYDKLRFDDITTDWLERFESHLENKRSNKHNTRMWHLQHIRTIINDAAGDGLVAINPFRKFHSLTPVAAKRPIEPSVLRDILLTTGIKHQASLDLFKLSFYLIGMNMVDILHLPPNAIVDGRIEYVRQKLQRGHKELSIKVEAEALEIINRYKGKKHLLRFLEEELAKPKYKAKPETKSDAYAAIVRRVDNHLKQVRTGLSTYYARHSWATIANNHCEIPDELIAQALGHSSAHRTTKIYITLADKRVDEANRKVIDFVLYGNKKTGKD